MILKRTNSLTLSSRGLNNVEGLRTRIGLQKQLYEQLEIQRKLQLQVEEHSKCLETIIVKQSESLRSLESYQAVKMDPSRFWVTIRQLRKGRYALIQQNRGNECHI